MVRGVSFLVLLFDSDGGSMRRELVVRDNNDYRICFGRVIGWPD